MTLTNYDKTNKLSEQENLTTDEAIALLLMREKRSRFSFGSDGTRLIPIRNHS
jgi:hypothetical protein